MKQLNESIKGKISKILLFRSLKKSESFKDLVNSTRNKEVDLYNKLVRNKIKDQKLAQLFDNKLLSIENYNNQLLNLTSKFVSIERSEGLVLKNLILQSDRTLFTNEVIKQINAIETPYFNEVKKLVIDLTMSFAATLIVISFIIGFMIFIINYLGKDKQEVDVSKMNVEEYYTKELSKITGDNTIKVLYVNNNKLRVYSVGGTPYIVLYAAMERIFTEREIFAMLLHEYGHLRGGQYVIQRGMELGISTIGVMVIGMILNKIFKDKFSKNSRMVFTVVLSVITIMLVAPSLDPLIRKIMSKPREYLADSYAVKYGYGEDLKTALAMMEFRALKNLCPTLPKDACREKLEQMIEKAATHPSYQNRIKFAEKLLKNETIQKLIKSGERVSAIKWLIKIKDMFVLLLLKKNIE